MALDYPSWSSTLIRRTDLQRGGRPEEASPAVRARFPLVQRPGANGDPRVRYVGVPDRRTQSTSACARGSMQLQRVSARANGLRWGDLGGSMRFPDDFSLSDLFLDTERLQQFNDFPVAFAVKELLVGTGASVPGALQLPFRLGAA